MQRSSLGGAFSANFSPLRIRNFRIYLSGQAVSLIGTWLQITAQGIVVYKLSGGSATALGVVGMLNTLPLLLFGPLAGVWADRLDWRLLLIVSQVGAMCLAFTLAALLQTGLAQLWHVYVLAFCLGTITSIDFPAQQAFLGDLALMAEVRRAVNLNAMILQVSRMLGPAVAGSLVAWLGAAPAFWINGVSFGAVIGSLLLVRTQPAATQRGAGAAGGMRAALDFIRSQPRIQDLLVFVLLLTFFGLAVLTIVPAVARGVPQVTGWLLAASGFGALLSTVVLVPLSQAARYTGRVVAGAVLWMGGWFTVLSFVQWLPLQLVSMFGISLGALVVMTMALGLMQVLAPTGMRARLLSIFTILSFGMQPFAALLIGYNADALGTALAIRINGVILICAALLMLALRPGLRAWQPQPASPQSHTNKAGLRSTDRLMQGLLQPD